MKKHSGWFRSVRSGGVAALLICLMILSFGVVAANAAGDAVVVKEWKIPMLSVLTGPVAFAGLPAKWGAQYAVDEINAAGGIRGVPVKLTAYDTAMDNAKAVQMMARLVPGSLVVLGPLDGRGSTAIAQQLVDNKICALDSNTNAIMLDSSRPYSVAYMQDSGKGSVVGSRRWIKAEPWIKSVAMFYDPTDPASTSTTEMYEAGMKPTGVKVVRIEIGASQLDFGPPVLKALNQKVDGFYSSYLTQNHVSIAKELFNRGVTKGTELLGGMAGDGPELFTSGKGYLENSYFWENVNPVDASPRFQKLAAAFRKDFKGQLPNNPVINFYDSVYAIKAAIEAKKITGDPKKLMEERKAIDDFLYNSPELQGLQFKYRNVNGEKIAPYFLLQIKNNTFVKVDMLNE